MLWAEVQTQVEGCATSISVGADNIPVVTGCSGAADNAIYYLGTGTCAGGPSPCIPPRAWVQMPGLNAAQVYTAGEPFAVTSVGDVYAAVISPGKNCAGYPQITGWKKLVASTQGACLYHIAADLSPSDTDYHAIFGFGCTPNMNADRAIYEWDLDLDSAGFYAASPGWFQLDPQDDAAALRIALFTGSNNQQVLWVASAAGFVYSYNGSQFVQQPGGYVSDLTDHFALAGDVWVWSDTANNWSDYMSAVTPNGTTIVHIAAQQAINTPCIKAGPSSLWGLDTDGRIYFAYPQGQPPQ